jgi:hypothetical protein
MRPYFYGLAVLAGLFALGNGPCGKLDLAPAAITATPAVVRTEIAEPVKPGSNLPSSNVVCPCLSGEKCVCNGRCACIVESPSRVPERPATIQPVALKAKAPAKAPARAPVYTRRKLPAGYTCGPGGCGPASGGFARGRIFGRFRRR